MKTTITENRKALFDYELIQGYEAGIMLNGEEVNCIRNSSCNLKGSYIVFIEGEAFIRGMHISVEDSKNTKKDRKILLKKKDIIDMNELIRREGLTVIPTEIYLNGNLIKVNVSLAKGRKKYEKKQKLKEKDIARDMDIRIKNG